MTEKTSGSRCHETFHRAEDCPDCPSPASRAAKQAQEAAHIKEADDELAAGERMEAAFVQEAADRGFRVAASAKSAAVSLGKTRFRLDRLRISAVNVDSEPSKSMTNLARSLGHERPENHDWTDIVVTVTDQAGNVFEVARVACKYDGMLGESHMAGELVVRRSWGGESDDDSVSCPLCFERGHGAGACPRA
jgi:hypothetical protein